jgi:crotonobetainyl-CoA:carnitine CoA-transferase CaiB-like acyl-CoA transferase
LNPDSAGRTFPPNEYNGRLSNEMNTRLAGSQVLNLSTIVPGGTPSTILSDLGADLIKVESLTGSEGPHRRRCVAVNRARRSVALDITLPASRDVVLRLAAGSDVLLANFRGAKVAALGFDDEPTVRARWADNRQHYPACALENRSRPAVNSVW